MKYLIILTVTFLATASAGVYQPNFVVPAVETEGRITNGIIAAIGQFPYQVGLLSHLKDLSTRWCGGSLIGSNWVLTAAHCTINATDITVYLGTKTRLSPEVIHTVYAEDVIIHADYNHESVTNDISLIGIPKVEYSNKIKPVKLPAMDSSYSTYTGDYAITTGWGQISDDSEADEICLRWARFQVMSNTKCADWYDIGEVTANNICAATRGGVATCSGDSGGPLVLESTKEQIGVLSFGAAKSCVLGAPDVYTRLTNYLEWIKNNTGIAY